MSQNIQVTVKNLLCDIAGTAKFRIEVPDGINNQNAASLTGKNFQFQGCNYEITGLEHLPCEPPLYIVQDALCIMTRRLSISAPEPARCCHCGSITKGKGHVSGHANI